MVHVKNSMAVFIPIASQAVGAYELVGSTLVVGSTVVKAAVNCLQGIYYRKNETKLNDLQREWVVLKKDFNQAIYDIAMAILAITSVLGAVRYYMSNNSEKNKVEIARIIAKAKELENDDKDREAIEEFQKASKLGSIEADVEIALSLMYLDAGVEFDKGLAMLKKAAEKGNAEAQFRLGKHFKNLAKADVKAGRNTDENQRLKIYWLQQAAFQEHEDAQLDLSIFYAKANNKELDFYWTKAAADKSDRGRFNYSVDLFKKANAPGVSSGDAEKYRTEGRKYLLTAANNGHPSAMYKLGDYIEKSRNGFKEGPTEAEKARYWFDKAAIKGDKLAQGAIARLNAAEQKTSASANVPAPAAAQAAVAAASASASGPQKDDSEEKPSQCIIS